MGQTASQIENHIEDTRDDLSSNLRELENKVKSVTDWRHQFESRPMAFLGRRVWRRDAAGQGDRRAQQRRAASALLLRRNRNGELQRNIALDRRGFRARIAFFWPTFPGNGTGAPRVGKHQGRVSGGCRDSFEGLRGRICPRVFNAVQPGGSRAPFEDEQQLQSERVECRNPTSRRRDVGRRAAKT